MANKIYINHTLEEYNKKYGNKGLKKVNKVDADKDPKLLSAHSWWLIKDVYYQLPNNKGFKAWWSNLGKGGQIALCCLTGAAVVTAVVVPTVIAVTKNKSVDHKAVIDPEITDVTCTQKKLENGAIEITLNYDTTKKEIAELSVKIGNQTLIQGTDYFVEGNTITIPLDVLAKNNSPEIVVKPILKDKGPIIYVTDITCDESITLTVGDEISFDALNVKITPDNATDKTFEVLHGGKTNDESPIVIDSENKKIKAVEAGSEPVFVIPNGVDPEGEESIGTTCNIIVQEKSYKIDWASKKVDGTNTLYDLAKTSFVIAIGTNATYKETAEKLNDVVVYNAGEIGESEDAIQAYYGTNAEGKKELYVLCDDEIVFEDNDRFGRDMSGPTPKSGNGFFEDCLKDSSLKGGYIDLENINTSSVTDMSKMFNYCRYTTSFKNINKLTTSNVKDMSYMFYDCFSIEKIDVSSFDTSNVTNMASMFHMANENVCSEIIGLDKFNTSKVTNMSNMFRYCEKLEYLDVKSFDTSSVTNMSGMFMNLDIKSIDLSNFDTSNVTNMFDMFYNSNNLTILDLSSFDTSKVMNMSEMFMSGDTSSSKLTKIYVSDKFVVNNTKEEFQDSYMFKNCLKLVGGAGSTFSSIWNLDPDNCESSKYAKIDTDPTDKEKAGYFTDIKDKPTEITEDEFYGIYEGYSKTFQSSKAEYDSKQVSVSGVLAGDPISSFLDLKYDTTSGIRVYKGKVYEDGPKDWYDLAGGEEFVYNSDPGKGIKGHIKDLFETWSTESIKYIKAGKNVGYETTCDSRFGVERVMFNEQGYMIKYCYDGAFAGSGIDLNIKYTGDPEEPKTVSLDYEIALSEGEISIVEESKTTSITKSKDDITFTVKNDTDRVLIS